MNSTHSQDTWRELACRESDGLEVALLWDAKSDRVRVAVQHARLDERFAFEVLGADALAAFHHPYAYASDRPVDETPIVPERSAVK